MRLETHEVDFHKYCKRCQHRKLKDYEEPCNECLSNPVAMESKKPLFFKGNLFSKNVKGKGE